MTRQAFLMQLKPGNEADYKQRHDEIWPELKQALSESGISDYSIFLDRDSGTLFAIRKVEDEARLSPLPSLPIVRKWWNSMSPLMETNPDNSPTETPLVEVFHMD